MLLFHYRQSHSFCIKHRIVDILMLPRTLLALLVMHHPLPVLWAITVICLSGWVDDGPCIRWWSEKVITAEKLLSPGDTVALMTLKRNRSLTCCGDAGVNKPAALPLMCKCSPYNYVRYVILDNGNEQVCYWFMYLLYYTLYGYFKGYSFYL